MPYLKCYSIKDYRKAKNRALNGKVGVWVFKSSTHGIVVMFLCNNLDILKKVCSMYVDVPYSFVRKDKISRYKFYYVPIYGCHLRKYAELKTNKKRWLSCQRLK